MLAQWMIIDEHNKALIATPKIKLYAIIFSDVQRQKRDCKVLECATPGFFLQKDVYFKLNVFLWLTRVV